jgi:hypothetical protein
VWIYIDRFGREHHSEEGPFAQAKSARFALEELILKVGRQKNCGINSEQQIRKFCFGWGVIFPDCFFDSTSVEMPHEIIFDAGKFRSGKMEVWLRCLQSYWAKKTRKNYLLNKNDIRILLNIMRPEFDKVPALYSRVGDVVDELLSLTDSQYMVLDALLNNDRVLVEGGAGTGKSFIAIEAARRLSGSDKQVLFLCRSPVFSFFVRSQLRNTTVQVFHYDDLISQMSGGESFQPDVLIVDEGQDLLDLQCLENIETVLEGGFEHGKWLFFMDMNNQGALYDNYDGDVLDYLDSAAFRFPLTRNCRNTKQIAIQTFLYTGGDIGKCPVEGEGLPVDDSTCYTSRDKALEAVETQLDDWVDGEGVKLGEITILSPVSFEKSIVSSLSRRWRKKLFVIDRYLGDRWLDSMLTFATIRDFKGLENRCIMLVDLEFLDEKNYVSMLYVGMTRANAILWMCIPESTREMLHAARLQNVKHFASFFS